MIIHKENIYFKTYCTHYVGDYVQDYENLNVKNDQVLLALACVYLN